ncbi:MAG TPA: hypothetical protein DCO79_15160 [Spirochaeta sp.]|nr:hypothetical protein [Spirochaeta sp.]
MSVVTISRTIGSGGEDIGRRLAEETGYLYIDKDRIADIIKEYGIVRLDDIYNSVNHLWDRIDEYKKTTINFLAETIIAIAQHGNVVIAGRGSYGILQDFGGVYNVRIQAPQNIRIENESEKLGISFEEASKTVKEDDRLRNKFIESNFYFIPNHVELFDIVLNSAAIAPDDCVKILTSVCTGVDTEQRKKNLRELSSHKVDKVLKQHIEKKLSQH